jgi:hypothetical protein
MSSTWWVGIGLSVVVVTMTPMKSMTSVTVPPTIPAATVPAVSSPSAPSTPNTSAPPSESPASTGGDGNADVLGCDAPLFDPNSELDAPEVERAIERTARTLGADVHVRAEGTVDAGLDERMTQLEARCPTWTTGTERAGDLVVVMYSSVEREASVYYGADQGFALEDRWEPAVDAMTVRFRVGDFTGGVVDGLEALGDFATSSVSDDAGDAGGTDDDESSDSPGLPGVVWLVIVGVVALLIYNIARFLRTGEWGDEASDDGGSSGWTSSSRRRSFGSFGSSARRSSRSSSRRSSSSGRRRSGGGTKKW